MNKLQLTLKSRTFWTLVAMFVVNGVSGISDSIPPTYKALVDFVLLGAATYFHITPSQNYNGNQPLG